MSTKAQMEALPDNIRTLRRIEDEYGSVDSFITSEPADVIVEKLSKGASSYKLKMLGEALAWEYLRNVGIDGANRIPIYVDSLGLTGWEQEIILRRLLVK